MVTQVLLPFEGMANVTRAEEKEIMVEIAHEEELVRLERFVEKLLENYNALKSEYNILKERLLEKDQENKELQATLDRFQNDRKVMHSRVAGLIDKIEDWERAQETYEDGTSFSEKEQRRETASGELDQTFTMGIE